LLIDILFLFGMELALLVTAGGWAAVFCGRFVNTKFYVLSQIFGMAIILAVSASVLGLNLPLTFVFPTIATAGLFGWFVAFRTNLLPSFKISLRDSAKHAWRSYVYLPGFIVIALQNQGWISTAFSYRAGPDNFGWADAALVLCRDNGIGNLVARVTKDLGRTPMLQSFASQSNVGQISINQISSFTDQVAAEFLVGAHRTGIPGAMAALCRLANDSVVSTLIVALAAWAIVLCARILKNQLAFDSGRVGALDAAFIVGSLTGIGLLNVLLEGGFGQIVTIPFFLVVIAELIRRDFEFERFLILLATTFVVACTSYLDMLFLLIPMATLTMLWRHLKLRNLSYSTAKISLITSASIAALSWPIWPSLLRLAIFPLQHASAGGWSIGWAPLPSDLISVTSSLGDPFSPGSHRDPASLIFSTLITLTLGCLYIFATQIQRIGILVVFLAYAYLLLSVYVMSADENNYRLWKYAAYATVLAPLLFLGRGAERAPAKSGERKTLVNLVLRSKRLPRVILSALTTVMILTSLSYSNNWFSTRSSTLTAQNGKILAKYLDRYDLVISDALYKAMYTMYGDLHYAAFDRGRGEVRFSNPPRPLLYLLPASVTCGLECLPARPGFNGLGFHLKFLEETSQFKLAILTKTESPLTKSIG
jgi:hypothetical protein